jgi:hypothetical protein
MRRHDGRRGARRMEEQFDELLGSERRLRVSVALLHRPVEGYVTIFGALVNPEQRRAVRTEHQQDQQRS